MTTWEDLFERGATYEVDRERIRVMSDVLDADGDDITDDADDTNNTDDTDGAEPAPEDDDG